MKVVFIVQEDHFVIPRNIERVLDLEEVEGAGVFILDTTGAVVNRKRIFLKGFGVMQGARMGLRLLTAKLFDRIDLLFGARLLARKRSIRAVAMSRGVPVEVTGNPNRGEFLEKLRDIAPDLVVSFSAPCVFKPPLLEIPRLGCINLHCSLLPDYAGLLPSFWVLYHEEEEAGASVHYMDDKIDNGGILGQVRIAVQPGMTMMDLIRATKDAGGKLMARIVKDVAHDREESHPNPADEGSYFSWPTVEQMREFRAKGGRLI